MKWWIEVAENLAWLARDLTSCIRAAYGLGGFREHRSCVLPREAIVVSNCFDGQLSRRTKEKPLVLRELF